MSSFLHHLPDKNHIGDTNEMIPHLPEGSLVAQTPPSNTLVSQKPVNSHTQTLIAISKMETTANPHTQTATTTHHALTTPLPCTLMP